MAAGLALGGGGWAGGRRRRRGQRYPGRSCSFKGKGRGGQGERRKGGAGSEDFPESKVLIPGLYLNLSPLISVF